MTDIRRTIATLAATEEELTFQAKRVRELGKAQGNARLLNLGNEYTTAAAIVRKLRTHQTRRANLLETGDARGEAV